MKRAWLTSFLLLGVVSAQDLRFAADRPFDLLHVRVEARVDLPKKSLVGRATLAMRALRESDTIRLDAVNLDVKRVTVGGAETKFANDGRFLDVMLKDPVRRGAEIGIVVEYACVKPEKGLFFYGPSKAQPGVEWQVWSQGESVDNRHWIPLFDHPNERITSELLITVDAGLQVLSNGANVSRTENKDGTTTWHWHQRKDHAPYLITLVVGKFAITTDTWRGRPVEYWVPHVANEMNASVVVIGTRALGGVKGALIGNTAERILHRLNADVLVMRPGLSGVFFVNKLQICVFSLSYCFIWFIL